MKAAILAATIVLLTLPIVQSEARSKTQYSLKQCKGIYEEMEEIQDARRKGGSSSYMNRLREDREHWREQFRIGNCKKYGKKVRK